MAIRRPRSSLGANSDISGQPTEYSAPIAIPINSRTTSSISNEPTKNCSIDATTNSAMSIMNNGLRPHLSPAHPPSGEPIRIPNSAIDATRPTCPRRHAQIFLHRARYRTDDPEDVAVQEHPADQNGEQPPHEASLECRRGFGRIDS